MATPTKSAPSNIVAEQTLLGCILLEPDTVYTVLTEPREFYFEKHRWIFEAMRDCKTPDFLTVLSKLTEQKRLEQVGGAGYLTSLLNSVTTASGAAEAAALVKREFLKREVIQASTMAVELMYNADELDTAELVPMAAARFNDIQAGAQADSLVHVGAAIDEWMPEFIGGIDEDPPIPTGLDLDKYTRGLKRGQFWLVGGDPGKGKTSLVMQIATEAALRGHRVLVFSLEMTRKELVRRLASTFAFVSNETIDHKSYNAEEKERILDAIARINRSPLYIDDSVQTSQTIWMRCRAMAAQGNKPDLVICDYSRLLLDEAKNEDLRTNNITRTFKLIARELQCTTMLVHWMNVSGGFKYGGLYDPDVAVICNQVDGQWLWQLEKNRNGDACAVKAKYKGEYYRWGNQEKTERESRGVRMTAPPVFDGIPRV